MAYQPKSYRKFIAGAAAAAVVAPIAVAPVAFAASFTDVPAQYQEAVEFLTAKGIQGTTETTFGTYENIKRVDAAVMLVKALGLDVDAAPASGFTDVPERAVKAVNALKEAGITNGKTATTFDSQALITRGELAIWIQRGFALETGENASSFTDVPAQYADAISALVKAEVTNGTSETTFGTYNNAKRGDFAVFLLRADQAIAELSVQGVTATDSKTLTITGTGLKQLAVEGISVENNTVAELTVAENGRTATVTLGSELVVDQTTKVKVQDAEFDVTYSVNASQVSVDTVTYDDDTKDQFVSIKINGNKVTAQELINAGYDVKFEAYSTKTAAAGSDVTTDLFESTTTGELKTDLATTFAPLPVDGKKLYVKVTLTKGSEVITSSLAEVKVKNIDLSADSITAAELTNSVTGFVQNSTTLVTGETAEFTELTVKSASNEDDVTGGFTVKTSNEAVISVDKNTNVLTAQGPGTATITVTYGGAEYTKTFTVKNEERKATKVEADKTAVTAIKGATTTFKVKLLDQYGDAIAIANNNVNLEVSDANKVGAQIANSVGDKGEATVTVTGNDTGSAIITFRDAANVKIGTTAVKVTVTENATLAKLELKADTDISNGNVTDVDGVVTDAAVVKNQISTDSTLDLKDDKYIKIDLKGLNSAGAELAKLTTGEYTVEANVSKAGVLAKTTDADIAKGEGFFVLEAGTETGTATITVKSVANGNISATFKVTVEKVGYEVTGATFKNVGAPSYAQTLNYEDFLTYTESANDPTISGIKLSKSVAQPVRLDNAGNLYVDKNADGVFNNEDFYVGSLELTTTGTIADTNVDAINGVDVTTGDDGTVLFKVLDTEGKVVATKALTVEL
ncbi:S-layer homology domain-containing protein [Niallia endozanthoxylica]|uniref:S-layer homology domain-containing protein n=1 Tax=Niallia endozanthoxylica TaxID=2036016 RepID=A0A5J5H4E4_9BACI|nr:S-layer homology domain-containing protein [Niallia endozanthoxylica]KAA9015519.1 S-layer homology domain-containing protein [Niallia endozanthoxylica]